MNRDEYGLSEAEHHYALQAQVGRKPKLRRGKYGKQYDSHTCGQCGYIVSVTDNFCPKCGFRILWDDPKCITGMKEDE